MCIEEGFAGDLFLILFVFVILYTNKCSYAFIYRLENLLKRKDGIESN